MTINYHLRLVARIAIVYRYVHRIVMLPTFVLFFVQVYRLSSPVYRLCQRPV